MKKLLVVTALVIVALALVACGGGNGGTDSAASDSNSGANSVSSDSGSSTAMEEFVDQYSSQFETAIAQNQPEGMTVEVAAEGNSLVFGFTSETDVGDLETSKAELKGAAEALESGISPILDMLKAQVPEAESIIVRYLNNDGTEIYTQEIK